MEREAGGVKWAVDPPSRKAMGDLAGGFPKCNAPGLGGLQTGVLRGDHLADAKQPLEKEAPS